jgi:hypothetical protein
LPSAPQGQTQYTVPQAHGIMFGGAQKQSLKQSDQPVKLKQPSDKIPLYFGSDSRGNGNWSFDPNNP